MKHLFQHFYKTNKNQTLLNIDHSFDELQKKLDDQKALILDYFDINPICYDRTLWEIITFKPKIWLTRDDVEESLELGILDCITNLESRVLAMVEDYYTLEEKMLDLSFSRSDLADIEADEIYQPLIVRPIW